jgi:hypothetical protein
MYNIADVLPQICHGNLNQYMLEMMIHKEPIIPFKEKILYRKILSPHDKMIKILSNIADEDIYPIIVNERIQYIKVVYRRFNDVMIIELDIMKYGHWLPLSDSTILKEIVRSSHIVSKIFITPMRELLIDVEQISPEFVM